MLSRLIVATVLFFGLAVGPARALTLSLFGSFTDSTEASGAFSLNVYGFPDGATLALDTRDGAIAGFAYRPATASASVTYTLGITSFEFTRGDLGYQSDFRLTLLAPLHNGLNGLDLTQSYECIGSFSCYDPASTAGSRRSFTSGFLAVPVGPLPLPAAALLLAVPLLLRGTRRG